MLQSRVSRLAHILNWGDRYSQIYLRGGIVEMSFLAQMSFFQDGVWTVILTKSAALRSMERTVLLNSALGPSSFVAFL